MIKNFKFTELIRTSTKINNVPTDCNIVDNILLTASYLQAIRDRFKGAIRVNSCYRSEAVNVAVGGSKTSAHLKGLAADICAYSGKAADNESLWQLLTAHLQDMDVDQAICYTLDGTQATSIKWIHVGFTEGVPRHQILYKK